MTIVLGEVKIANQLGEVSVKKDVYEHNFSIFRRN